MDTQQIIFLTIVMLAFGVFGFTMFRLAKVLRLTQALPPYKDLWKRAWITTKVAFGQTKMFKRPIAGLLHALVWWGFLVITVGTMELIVDGISGSTRILSALGSAYNAITISGEVFAILVIISCIIFLLRRYLVKPKRFTGTEMKPSSKYDATFILLMILILMVSLLGMNIGYVASHETAIVGAFPISNLMIDAGILNILPSNLHRVEIINMWIHIILVFVFLNYLPYSKHFHVLLAVPNIFFSRLEPMAKLNTMESITREIKLMSATDTATAEPEISTTPKRFGVKDVEDVSWKTLLDANTCTECGRCTEVCPANITGKKLSPRKLYIDLRERMNEKKSGLMEEGMSFTDNKSLVGDYITTEELWACTSCMACIEECPVNIDHVPFIMDMRRSLVMEESSATPELNNMFANIENNGAPWPFSSEDRLNWTEGIEVRTMADFQAKGESPEVLFWVGCAGAFDDRYKKVTRAFAQILNEAGISFAVLGKEESCTGDPAKRAGHEYLYQKQAMGNIEILNNYNIKKIVTACPHCFNILLNEYGDLDGNYEVIHHSVFLEQLIKEGKINIADDNAFSGKKVTYHDSCYIGRGNGIYDAPRTVVESLKVDLKEMSQNRQKGLCCGAGGAQMFKDEEKGDQGVNIKRTEQALETGAEIVASACPFCMTMMSDGMKAKNKEEEVRIMDLAELIAESLESRVADR